MRIIAGKWKKFSLLSPKTALTRPTSDRLRETIFNILNSYFLKSNTSFEELKVLDVFAGTGALGLEAVSRGASQATFIEKSKEACQVIRHNIASLKAQSQCSVIQADIMTVKAPKQTFDLIFLDAPYHEGFTEKALEKLCSPLWFNPPGIAVVETAAAENLRLNEHQWEILDHRCVGSAGLWILTLKEIKREREREKEKG